MRNSLQAHTEALFFLPRMTEASYGEISGKHQHSEASPTTDPHKLRRMETQTVMGFYISMQHLVSSSLAKPLSRVICAFVHARTHVCVLLP